MGFRGPWVLSRARGRGSEEAPETTARQSIDTLREVSDDVRKAVDANKHLFVVPEQILEVAPSTTDRELEGIWYPADDADLASMELPSHMLYAIQAGSARARVKSSLCGVSCSGV